MLALNGKKVLLVVSLSALVSACSAPCDAPGRLCAPISSITSVPPPAPAPLRPAAPVAPPPPLPKRLSELPPPEPAQTFAVDLSSGSVEAGGTVEAGGADLPAGQVRIALLLPLHSEALGPAAEALKAGFLAGYERDRDNFAVDVVDTGDAAQDVLASYAAAGERHDVIVGPLARSAVTAVAGSALVGKTTIALNSPEGRADQPLPPAMLVMGLSIEEEARQAALWAAADHPHASALIVSGGTAWQRRIAGAYAAQWQRLGLPARTAELGALNGELGEGDLAALKASLTAQPAELLFAALGAAEARQLRAALGAGLPMYGTSALNPGDGALPELDGVRLLDLPWQVQRDHPAVMVYPRPLGGEAPRKPGTADLERLYALGIDAYRVARRIGRQRSARFDMDGVTGKLKVSFGEGPASFERIEQMTVYQNGVALPVAP
ncbi:penicillin-binding protein activator [Rugamonas sp.]|uniref:penicillin-binding protein activator n=1 Tax=Rugamonas sp. TaxID=1926287 RepID=UPI0025EB1B6E|nr:penicillin-binding protein activator [Rugamonas sp.]